jgi:hypothetical protein
MLDPGGEEGYVARFDLDPPPAQVDLALALDARQPFLGPVVAVRLALIPWPEREDVEALGLKNRCRARR